MSETPPNDGSARAMPDALSEAMVATAAGYFISEGTKGCESTEEFRQILRNMYESWPHQARAILTAGLLAAGFTIEVDPLFVDTPDVSPEEALDTRCLMFNSYLVAPTVIDMGLQASTKDHPQYDGGIVKRVVEELSTLETIA